MDQSVSIDIIRYENIDSPSAASIDTIDVTQFADLQTKGNNLLNFKIRDPRFIIAQRFKPPKVSFSIIFNS